MKQACNPQHRFSNTPSKQGVEHELEAGEACSRSRSQVELCGFVWFIQDSQKLECVLMNVWLLCESIPRNQVSFKMQDRLFDLLFAVLLFTILKCVLLTDSIKNSHLKLDCWDIAFSMQINNKHLLFQEELKRCVHIKRCQERQLKEFYVTH